MFKKVLEKPIKGIGVRFMVIAMRRGYEIQRRVSEKPRGEGQTVR